MSIRELVENPHPIFEKYSPYFRFLLDSYEGGIDYTDAQVLASSVKNTKQDSSVQVYVNGKAWSNVTAGNLFKHPKEREVDYEDRVKMSYYYNFCAPIIDIYTDHLFKQPVKEDWGNIEADVLERSENIDNKGGSIGEFRKEAADLAQIYGHIFVITDSPQFNGSIISKADILDNGLLPYFTFHHPQNVINWALDVFGAPYWVLIREFLDLNKDAFKFDKSAREGVQYRLWTREEWVLYDGGYNEIGRGKHGLGIVPITCLFDKQSKKVRNFMGISAIADIAFIARDVYNSCSELKQILRDQTFAFLALQGDGGTYSEVEIGANKGLVYPVGTNVPQYVSPQSSNAEIYFKHIDRQVQKMFQLAKLEGGSVQAPEGQSAIQQSGVSKAWDFNQTNSALSKKAGNLEDGETKLWQTYARWLDTEFDGSVEYPHEFSIQSLNEDLDEAKKIFEMQLGAEFNMVVKEAIMKKKFPRMNEDEMSKMIDTMKTQEQTAGQSSSSQLLNRIPSLNRMAMLNANSGGK